MDPLIVETATEAGHPADPPPGGWPEAEPIKPVQFKSNYRVKYVRLPAAHVLDLLRRNSENAPQVQLHLKATGIPDDVCVLSVREDPWNRNFLVLVEHPSFDAVPEGAEIPVMPGLPGWEYRVVEYAPYRTEVDPDGNSVVLYTRHCPPG